MYLENNYKNKILSLLASFLLIVFVFQIFNKSLNLHTHKFANGQIVIHAHPYDKTNDSKPYKSHHHSLFEIVLLESLNLLFPIIVTSLLLIVSAFKVNYFLTTQGLGFADFNLLHKNRAPPVSLYYI